jgi:transcription antitermination factor NusG
VNITNGYEQKIKNTIETQEELRQIPKRVLVPIIKRKRHLRDKLYFFSEKIFPGYVFVACRQEDEDALFASIASVPGVINMSSTRGARRFFAKIDEEEMHHVLELISDNKERAEEMSGLISHNSKVRVIEGPFASFHGIVTDINKASGREAKVKITTSIFDGGLTTIVIPISFVEPI